MLRLLLVLFAALAASSLKLNNGMKSFKPTNMLKHSVGRIDLITSSLALIAAPMAAHAEGEQSAFAFPLAISLLTMVPFLYYVRQTNQYCTYILH